MRNTPNMGLTAPATQQDLYNYAVNAQNLYLTDYHDHSPGRGARLTGASITPGSLSGIHFNTSSSLNISSIQYSGTGGVAGPPGIQLPITIVSGVSSLTPISIPAQASHCRITLIGAGQGGGGGGGGGSTGYGGGGGGGGAPGEYRVLGLIPLSSVSKITALGPVGGVGGNGGGVGASGTGGANATSNSIVNLTTSDGWTTEFYANFGGNAGSTPGPGTGGASGAGGTGGSPGTSQFVISQSTSVSAGQFNTTASGGAGGTGVNSATVNPGSNPTRSLNGNGATPGGGGSGGGLFGATTYGGASGWGGNTTSSGNSAASFASTGQNGNLYGAGGGGGAGGNVGGSGSAGGNGGPGAVIIEWFTFYKVNAS